MYTGSNQRYFFPQTHKLAIIMWFWVFYDQL
jgi:hypothetical protein